LYICPVVEHRCECDATWTETVDMPRTPQDAVREYLERSNEEAIRQNRINARVLIATVAAVALVLLAGAGAFIWQAVAQ
jgi:hypothetical protein